MRIFQTSLMPKTARSGHLVSDLPSGSYELEFADIKRRRNAMIAEATKAAEALGHRLFRNWAPLFNTNRCRKCGMTVALPNVYSKLTDQNHAGEAVTSKCNIHLDDADWTFDVTDAILDAGVPLNRDQLTAIAKQAEAKMRVIRLSQAYRFPNQCPSVRRPVGR